MILDRLETGIRLTALPPSCHDLNKENEFSIQEQSDGIVTPPDLRQFFAPSAVAVVGATADRTRFGGKVLHRLQHFGATGPVFPVNPSSREINGLACFPSLRELPQVPDHVGIMVPTAKVFGVLEECAELGVPFATVFSSGFGETGTPEGRGLQTRLSDVARETGVRIMGPNCNGLVNFVDGFAMTSSGTVLGPRRKAGNIGLASQSGGAAQVNVMWRAQQAGLDLSYQVSCGNSADLDVLDFVDFMIQDPHTDVVMVIVEAFRSGQKLFATASRAAAEGKPIVVLKLGRTEAGSRAAASHTGALTGADEVHDAAFRQAGIIRVDDCNELYECAMLLRTKRLPRGRGLAALSASGGNAVLLADLGAQLGIQWPQYRLETQKALETILPKHGQANNPTDVTSAVIGEEDSYRRVIETIASDPNVDVVVPLLTLALKSDVEQVSQAVQNLAKPAAILWTGGCSDAPDLTPATLVARGIPVFREAKSCLRAVSAAMVYAEFAKCRANAHGSAPSRGFPHDAARVRHILADAPKTLIEAKAKRVLESYGIRVARDTLVTTADAAIAAARVFSGPVVLKIQSEQIVHKTEAGGVRLNIQGDVAVCRAFTEILAAARTYAPGAAIDGVLVQEMVPAGGVEMIIGIASDPTFGSVIMAGLGGIYAEIFKDVAYRVGPITEPEALEMIQELRAFALLRGARGQAPKDISAFCGAISSVSWLAHDFAGEILELDINPIIVLDEGGGVCAADALITQAGRMPLTAANGSGVPVEVVA
jgi:acyl-CoA synthetase (NDP forming)